LSIASRTQSTIEVLAANTDIQAETSSRQAKALDQNLKAIETNIDDLSRKTGKTSAMIQRHVKRLFRLMQDIKEMFTL
jgi:peptidoglycan hydrolase CwlO-like protein